MKRMVAGISLYIMLLVGCASVSQVATTAGTMMCLPPGFAALPPPSAIQRMEGLRTTAGPGVLIHYQTPTGPLAVVFVEGEPLAIDPKPDDPAAPVWVRTSLDSCQWRSEVVGATTT